MTKDEVIQEDKISLLLKGRILDLVAQQEDEPPDDLRQYYNEDDYDDREEFEAFGPTNRESSESESNTTKTIQEENPWGRDRVKGGEWKDLTKRTGKCDSGL